MDQSGSTGSEAPQPPAAPTPAAPAPTTQWAPPPPVVQAGPTGFVYADVPNRAIAYIIDAILIAIVGGIIGAILGGVGLHPATFDLTRGFTYDPVAGLIVGAIQLAISGVYFVYTWTAMRGTPGMKVLGMQIGNAVDGKTLTMDQAIRRWLIIAAPGALSQAVIPFATIGALLAFVAFLWFCYLLYTTWKSPTKQGFHDIFAHTMVVKATNTAS
jgi:uncharacterized RDD family membrane protein YckC